MQQKFQSKPQVTQTSISAVTSFVLGIMSPVVLCSCLPTILTSLLAIVLGHVALVKIGRSNGALLGRWQAITGLVLGYVFLPLSLYLAPFFFSPAPSGATAARTSTPRTNTFVRSEFDEANLKLGSNGSSTGNSPEATKLAQQFSKNLSALINAGIVEDGGWGEDKKLNSRCSVYCQLKDDRVCFLARVPRYRNYQDSARDVLEKFAWASGRATIADSELQGISEMGIGLRGVILYGSVMRGRIDADTPDSKSKSKSRLNSFFD